MDCGDLNYAARHDFMYEDILSRPQLFARLSRDSRLQFLATLSDYMRKRYVEEVAVSEWPSFFWRRNRRRGAPRLSCAVIRYMINRGIAKQSEVVLEIERPGSLVEKFPGLRPAQIAMLLPWRDRGNGRLYVEWARLELMLRDKRELERRWRREAA